MRFWYPTDPQITLLANVCGSRTVTFEVRITSAREGGGHDSVRWSRCFQHLLGIIPRWGIASSAASCVGYVIPALHSIKNASYQHHVSTRSAP